MDNIAQLLRTSGGRGGKTCVLFRGIQSASRYSSPLETGDLYLLTNVVHALLFLDKGCC